MLLVYEALATFLIEFTLGKVHLGVLLHELRQHVLQYASAYVSMRQHTSAYA